MKPLFFLLCACLISGCKLVGPEENGRVELMTEQSVYTAGANVTVVLTNNSPVSIDFNLCGADLQQQTGNAWIAVEQGDAICHRVLYGLRPGGSMQSVLPLTAGLSPGTYRFKDLVTPRGLSAYEVTTNAFSIVP